MRSRTAVQIWCLLFLLVSQGSGALAPISINGTKLYDVDGNQFFTKGVIYAPSDVTTMLDVLLDSSQCDIDAGLMKTLGVNAIRVYTVDGSQNHDACMRSFESQDIYVWVDLSTPLHAIDRNTPEWTLDLYTNWTATVDAFSKYDNLLFFSIGNEIINSASSVDTAPIIKAATRDIKAYQSARGYRMIPLSYNAADSLETREYTADYLTCGPLGSCIDVYGMNVYSWCGNSSYYVSGFDKLYEQFQAMSIPVLFAETGCNTISPRDFSDVGTMLGPVFQAVFSGAFVYEWAMATNGYGIVNYTNGEGTGFPQTLDDYNALKTVFSTATPTGTALSDYTPSNTQPACPATDTVWSVPGSAVLPTIANLEVSTVARVTTYTSPLATSSGGSAVTVASAVDTGSTTTPPATSNTVLSTSLQTQDAQSLLSTGAIAGIAVGGVVIGVAAALGIFYFIWRRRKRAVRKAAETEKVSSEGSSSEGGALMGGDPDEGVQMGRAELPAVSAASVVPRQELAASNDGHEGYYGADARQAMKRQGPVHEAEDAQVLEMDGVRPAGEIDGRPIVHELDAGQRHSSRFGPSDS
ncbi:1 3-beta-glucanosyltransferase gel4 [Oleoguttula sp. CCFEE 5521]